MSNYQLIKLQDPNNEYDQTKVTHEFYAVDLSEMLEQFQDFLKGCGYQFSGNIEIVDEVTDETRDD